MAIVCVSLLQHTSFSRSRAWGTGNTVIAVTAILTVTIFRTGIRIWAWRWRHLSLGGDRSMGRWGCWSCWLRSLGFTRSLGPSRGRCLLDFWNLLERNLQNPEPSWYLAFPEPGSQNWFRPNLEEQNLTRRNPSNTETFEFSGTQPSEPGTLVAGTRFLGTAKPVGTHRNPDPGYPELVPRNRKTCHPVPEPGSFPEARPEHTEIYIVQRPHSILLLGKKRY